MFVATKVCLAQQVLSRQNYVCRNKTFAYLCHNKRFVLSQQTHLLQLCQNYICRDKSFVVTKICLLQQTYFCCDKRRILFCGNKKYLWQLPPMTAVPCWLVGVALCWLVGVALCWLVGVALCWLVGVALCWLVGVALCQLVGCIMILVWFKHTNKRVYLFHFMPLIWVRIYYVLHVFL